MAFDCVTAVTVQRYVIWRQFSESLKVFTGQINVYDESEGDAAAAAADDDDDAIFIKVWAAWAGATRT